MLAALAVFGDLRSAAGATLSGPAKPADGGSAGLVISYADLIDTTAVTRTGLRLSEAVRQARTPRAHLQPFLDGYSTLLPYVVEMARGADPVPLHDIVERWPEASPQPAWVALFRGGRYRAAADGQGRVRLFLPGDGAAAAWRKHYPAVRHCLAALAAGGTPLSVEIFAYRNDYRRQELVLDMRSVMVAGSSFPPDRTPLDVAPLDDFFRTGARLEGARLDPAEGLVLYGNPDHHDTLAGESISLADLAVAYRAVFHAGDNDAFISLDPNADPALASVNFGGYLEDTRLGAVALAADRIFKTIASGLDPVTFRDRREEIRKRFPTFLTNSERRFIDGNAPPTSVWMKVRCWFYPDSIRVDSDPVEGYAVITRPQFTAATERLVTGLGNVTTAEKRVELPPWLEENIRNINTDYARYSSAFPEFGDLAPLARLMAVAAWLRRSDTSWLDLDALLAVELPAVSTPRTLEQLVSGEYVAVPSSKRITGSNVATSSGVIWLTPVLQRTVGEVFVDPKILADYLCAVRKPAAQLCSRSEYEDAALFDANRGRPLRALLNAGEEIVPLLDFLSVKIQYPLSSRKIVLEAQQADDRQRLQRLEGLRAELAAASAAADADGDASAARQDRQRIEAEIAEIMESYHDGSRTAGVWRTKFSFQMHGGISLSPEDFSIRRSAAGAAMHLFKRQAKGAFSATETNKGAGSLVRSNASGVSPPAAVPERPRTGAAGKRPRQTPAPRTTPGDPSAGGSRSPSAPEQAPPAVTAAPLAVESAPVAAGRAGVPKLATKSVSVPAGTAGAAGVQGELGTDGRIIFHKVKR